ncbi:MAG: hypothetical protein H8E35_16630 [Ardenticatenia bacterium]|nr:hypothetical protein [Ardenticatenia bacterium]
MLRAAVQRLHLSARACHRILKLARIPIEQVSLLAGCQRRFSGLHLRPEPRILPHCYQGRTLWLALTP